MARSKGWSFNPAEKHLLRVLVRQEIEAVEKALAQAEADPEFGPDSRLAHLFRGQITNLRQIAAEMPEA